MVGHSDVIETCNQMWSKEAQPKTEKHNWDFDDMVICWPYFQDGKQLAYESSDWEENKAFCESLGDINEWWNATKLKLFSTQKREY